MGVGACMCIVQGRCRCTGGAGMRRHRAWVCVAGLTSYTLRCMGLRRSQTMKSFLRPMLAGLLAVWVLACVAALLPPPLLLLAPAAPPLPAADPCASPSSLELRAARVQP